MLLQLDELLRIASLQLRAKKVVEGFLCGMHHSKHKGFSTEFFHHRQYSPGDEVRWIDWKVYAKNDRYVVKQFVEDTMMRAYIVLDVSASMRYPSTRHHALVESRKWEYARSMAAALAYLMIMQHDAVGFVTFDATVRTFIPAAAGTRHLHTLLHAMEHMEPAHTTDIAATLLDLGKRLKRRMLIIVISDLLQDQETVWKHLAHLAAHKHEVMVLHCVDPHERVLGFEGIAVCKDSETGEEEEVNTDEIREAYHTIVEDSLALYQKKARMLGIAYHLFSMDTPMEQALAAYLAMRAE